MEIQWDRIGREKYDRVVEALYSRLYKDADELRIYDGRGGDGGRDIYVGKGKRVQIFQLKYFPEGFSSSNGKRRAQINRSFVAAMEHRPAEWTLVVPCNLTDSELRFVNGLKSSPIMKNVKGASKVKVSYVDQARLNEQLSDNLNIVAYFMRDDSLAKAEIYNREIDVLKGGLADAATRIRALGSVIDDANLNWGVDFSFRNGEVVQVIRAKNDRAAQVNPIGIYLETEFGPEQKSIETAFRRATEYGVTEKVTLPPGVVKTFQITGPSMVASQDEHVEVTLLPASSPSLPFVIDFQDPDGQILSSHSGVTRQVGQASLGSSVVVDFYGAFAVTILFPHDPSNGGEFSTSANFDGIEPFSVLRVLQLIEALESSAFAVMRIDGMDLAKAGLNGENSLIPADRREDFERLRSLADDLNLVQRHCECYFPMPDEISGEDRLFLRCARLLIEGKCVVIPRMNVLTANLNGKDSSELRQAISNEAGVFLIENERFGFEIFGHSLMLGAARSFNPKASVTNAADALAALDAGTADGFQMRIAPLDTESFWTFLPGRWSGSPNESPRPVGWGLEDFNDPVDCLPVQAD